MKNVKIIMDKREKGKSKMRRKPLSWLGSAVSTTPRTVRELFLQQKKTWRPIDDVKSDGNIVKELFINLSLA